VLVPGQRVERWPRVLAGQFANRFAAANRAISLPQDEYGKLVDLESLPVGGDRSGEPAGGLGRTG
jgi:hypothetical protein